MKKSLLFLAVALISIASNAQITTYPWTEDFESGALPADFTFVDSDGDGNNWNVAQLRAHSGTHVAFSQSYNNETHSALTPDNWMILPAFTIPANASDFNLSWWVRGQDPNYAAEYYSVYIATGNSVNDFTATTAVYAGTATSEYVKHTVSLANYAGQTIYVAFRHHNVTDMFYLNIDDIRLGGPEPPILSITGSTLVTMGSQASYTATSDVTNIAWYIDGVQQSATGANFSTTLTSTGIHNVKAVATNAAGSTSDSIKTLVYDPANVAERTSLLEHFTTGQCQYCPSGHERLEQAMANYESRVCWVSHHVGFGTDAMTITESNQIAALFGSSTWAPAMMLDRNVEFAIDPEDGVIGSVGNVSDIRSALQAATNTPAFVTVNISDLNYNAQTRQLSVTVNGEFLYDFAGTEARLSLYLTEDSILGRQANAATQSYINNYVNNHVIRATLSNIWGDADAFTTTSAGSTYSKTFTYTLPNTFRANKCRLVAFVNDYGTDMLHRTVANATKSDYLLTSTDPTTVGITAVEASIAIKTYPNPATEMAYISAESTIRSYKMVDAMGRTILSEENVNVDMLELNVRDLAQGVYFISVTTDKGVASERLTIVK